MTPETSVKCVRLSVALSCCWPPPVTATKFQVVRFKILRFLCFINSVSLLLSLLYGIYTDYSNIFLVTKLAGFSIATAHSVLEIPLCAHQYERLQHLLRDMEKCIEQAKDYEQEIFQRYVDKCITFYGICIALFYMCSVIIDVGALLLSQPFPTEAKYPFSVEHPVVWSIIFVHQVIASLQTSSHICTNIFGALLLWFAAARFEILMTELRSVTTARELHACVRKHHELVRYAKEASAAARVIVAVALGISAAALIVIILTFISKQPTVIKLEFFAMAITGLAEILLCAWPADYLMSLSSDFVQGAYELIWYDKNVSLQKDVYYFLMAARMPITVSIGGLMPNLSLSYYSSYISNVFSFFTAIRVVIEGDRGK